MFTLALVLGLYSYLIFFLGIFGLLYKPLIILVTILYFFCSSYFLRKVIVKKSHLRQIEWVLIGLFVLQVIVNLVGALGPGLAFDALWYHLTLPKLFLENHRIFFIPGGLFYYSVMPKLGEMFYVSSLAFGSEIIAKIVHFSFGLLSCFAIYKIARKYTYFLFSLVAVVIFYSNLAVAWESTTAYIDLIRTFFELVSLWYWLTWAKQKKITFFIFSAVTLGLAIATKLVAISSLVIFLVLTFAELKRIHTPIVEIMKKITLYISVSLLIPLPWFVFSFETTHNPFYPFFTPVFAGVNHKIIVSLFSNPLVILQTFWQLFTHANDPISPLYLIFLPVIFYVYKHLPQQEKYINIYTILGILFWYGISAVEGSRFILPYLATFSVCIVVAIQKSNLKHIYTKMFTALVCAIALSSILYRGVTNSRYLPVIFGKQSKAEFLSSHLNFSFGDFYDIDGYFKTHIKQSDKVVLVGFHNEFYIDFPSIDGSYIQKGTAYNYVAVQNSTLPKEFTNATLSYSNPITHVKLYFVGNKIWQ